MHYKFFSLKGLPVKTKSKQTKKENNLSMCFPFFPPRITLSILTQQCMYVGNLRMLELSEMQQWLHSGPSRVGRASKSCVLYLVSLYNVGIWKLQVPVKFSLP